MGRAPVQEKVRNHLQVPMSEADWDLLRKQAANFGVSPPALVRMLLASLAKQTARMPPDEVRADLMVGGQDDEARS